MILDTTSGLETCTVVAATPDELRAIHQPACAAAIWQRDPRPGFQRWIDGVAPQHLPRARMILRPEAVRDALLHIVDAHETPDCAERDLLIEDAAALASIFASVMDSPYIRLRLDVIDTNACRKFHVDAVTTRLICTYRGTGTQYGLSENGQDPAKILTVPTGSAVLLRGTRWRETPVSGLLHRSPPIAGTGETRLLLVIDPVEDPAAEAGGDHMH